MIRTLAFAALLSLLPVTVRADSPDDAYLKLVDAAIAKPSDAKWCDIRAMYPDTSFYQAHLGLQIRKQTMQVGQKMLLDKTKQSVDAFRDFMRKQAAAVGAHYYAAYLYNWNSDLVKAKMEALLPDFGHGVDYIDPRFEKAAGDGLLACILKTGDGRSLATAYKVVTVDEEETLVDKYFRVDPIGLERQQDQGHEYTVLTIEIPDSKVREPIYFQLDDRLVKGVMAAHAADKLKPVFDKKTP